VRHTSAAALPAAALVAGALLWPVGSSPAHTTIGGSLSLSQRDVRVFDNFDDPTANDNTTPHPSFPGYTGAELAIWKAAVEWGSELHGDGQGDPYQPGGLGSGGANFDPSWQGLATGIGGWNANVHSQISGSDAGVLAYCEAPIQDGWRIRYYSNWTWDDGPGTSVTGRDLQGVATHEFGHALGLGHSSVPGATMYPSISGSGLAQRSIEADDAAGVQAIYGAKAASKPRILGSAVAGGQLELQGAAFAPANNEVWFTRRGTNGSGAPVVVAGVASTESGTRIHVLLPPDAGPGDVLVRVPGSGHAALSNAWPLDPDVDSTTGGPPVVLGVSPATVPALAATPVMVTLTGSGFTGVSALSVGGVDLAPEAFSVSDDSTLTFEVPLLDALGPAPIVVASPLGGSEPASLTVVEPWPPALRMGSPYAYSASGVDLWVGAGPGDTAFLAVSPDTIPSVIPGLVSLDIGADFTSLFVLGAPIVPPGGWVHIHVDVSGLAFGTQMHFQAAVWDASTWQPPFSESEVGVSTFYY
jgi:hypothetical protein